MWNGSLPRVDLQNLPVRFRPQVSYRHIRNDLVIWRSQFRQRRQENIRSSIAEGGPAAPVSHAGDGRTRPYGPGTRIPAKSHLAKFCQAFILPA